MPPWAPGLQRAAAHCSRPGAHRPGLLASHPFTVPHDAREPLQLRCTDGAVHLGILTDLGHASEHVKTQLAGCHTLLVEANHDPAMLAASRYPLFLQRRIAGPYGHMANTATAELLAALKHPSLGHVVAAHLSAHNNTPRWRRRPWPARWIGRLSASAWPARRRERLGSRWEWLDRKQILLAKQAMTPTAALLQSEQRHGAIKIKSRFSQKRGFGVTMQPLLRKGYLITNCWLRKQRQWQRQQRCQQQPWQRQQQEQRRQKQQEQLRKQLGLQERLQQQERSSCGSRCWCGFFFTASGQSSSSDQSGQNDGVLHFKFPVGQTKS